MENEGEKNRCCLLKRYILSALVPSGLRRFWFPLWWLGSFQLLVSWVFQQALHLRCVVWSIHDCCHTTFVCQEDDDVIVSLEAPDHFVQLPTQVFLRGWRCLCLFLGPDRFIQFLTLVFSQVLAELKTELTPSLSCCVVSSSRWEALASVAVIYDV